MVTRIMRASSALENRCQFLFLLFFLSVFSCEYRSPFETRYHVRHSEETFLFFFRVSILVSVEIFRTWPVARFAWPNLNRGNFLPDCRRPRETHDLETQNNKSARDETTVVVGWEVELTADYVKRALFSRVQVYISRDCVCVCVCTVRLKIVTWKERVRAADSSF